MRLIRAICRFIFGFTFILSGIFKALDPVGFSLKIDEYFGAFHLSFLDFLSDPIAVLFPVAEFVIGVAILKGLKIEIFSKIALAVIGFFTVLTFFVSLYDPVKDCGCFGEAIGFSNWESFTKNVILFLVALVIYFGRNKVRQIARSSVQWIYISLYAFIIFSVSFYSYISIPLIDFGVYQEGTDLNEAQNELKEREYLTTFIYEKDGIKESFTLDDLPDSSWVYVDSKTELISGDEDATLADFAVETLAGDYVADELLSDEDPIFIVSYYEDEQISAQDSLEIVSYADSLKLKGAEFYVLLADKDFDAAKLLPDNTLFADYKTIISFNRSNGGLTYLVNGVIVHKWASWKFPEDIDIIFDTDYEVITIASEMIERIFFTGLLFIVFFLIVIVRTVSVIIYRILQKRKQKLSKAETQQENVTQPPQSAELAEMSELSEETDSPESSEASEASELTEPIELSDVSDASELPETADMPDTTETSKKLETPETPEENK